MNFKKRYFLAIKARIKILFYAFYLIFVKTNSNIKKINGSKNFIYGNVKISRRIFKSYIKMKEDQKINIFSPSQLWQRNIKISYNDLLRSYELNSFEIFNEFVNNFGHSKNYNGLTYNILIPKFFKFLREQYIKKNMLDNQLKKWNFFTNTKNFKQLSTPRYGNHHGGLIGGSTFVTYSSFFKEIYGSMIVNFCNHKTNPVIAEIGGGYGEQAYFIIKKIKRCTYVNFDIPEVLILSMFYLMNSFPKKKFLLYGEKNFTSDCLKKYDCIFMPQIEIKKLNNSSIDLMVNQHSMGEMNRKTVHEYIKIIKKTSNFFFHMNHSFYKRKFGKNNYNLLSHEYNLERNGFDLILKYLDFNHFNYDYFQNYNMDIFFYLYKRSFK